MVTGNASASTVVEALLASLFSLAEPVAQPVSAVAAMSRPATKRGRSMSVLSG